MLILAVSELGLTCMQAAKMLTVPYTNAKFILRQFKYERRLVSHQKACRTYMDTANVFGESTGKIDIEKLRADVNKRLVSVIKDGQLPANTLKHLMMVN